MTYSEAIQYLYASRPPFHQVGASAYKPGLENTLRLMAHVGDPHLHLKAIHVAGTNGKGSTAHLIAAALHASGRKVGLFTSPHLVSLTERIRINGQPIPEQVIADFVTEHKAFLDAVQPSFFETMTALGFWYFVQQNVDIAVIEVGLGGRLDSTNVLTPILSVITNIGLDHTEFLGNTLTQIAREKAGIIKPQVPVVIGETHPQTMNVFLAKAQECGSEIFFADQCEYLRRTRLQVAPDCELHGNYQEHNLQTAFVALRELTNIQCPISNIQIAEGFAHVCTLTGLRGRWETLCERPLTICDTGHNSHGLQYVARQLKELTANHVWLVFGMVNDKDTDIVMRLMPQGERYHYIFTRPNTQRARSAQEMLTLWGREGMAIEDPQEALNYAIEQAASDDAIFIGGSNYLVGEVLSKRYQKAELL
ncbi:MAG: bifunctional folylpolyglutamate synthase/dihydrofolate synthase [Paludibacteraceae bacterium]|nr:bifunctional folylpolyglutamate synthase/dihydrofolate synthase [Paludibacteraceae bacterium]